MSQDLMNLDEAFEKFDPVLGFEVHVELNTTTKMFSAAPNAFGDEPNTNTTEVDLGMPGALPAVNKTAVESAIKLGLALNCHIAEKCGFARKQYFYPDLAKAFQTSQYDDPIASSGYVDVELDDGEIFRVEIERAHMEEDAGKLTHKGGSGRIQDASYSLVDYNRAGVPLIEIVTKPIEGAGDRAPELARAYVTAIRDIVKALNISDARMERGNVRCDANISLKPRGAEKFGTRTETKNVNSTRAVQNAVSYEIQRQAAILDQGGSVTQETRHWQETSKTTTSGRPKSDADDYRYFPEPDLVPIVTDQAWIDKLREELPEDPLARRRRLKGEWGYSDEEFRDVVAAGLIDEIDATVSAGASASAARKWWMGEIARLANEAEVAPHELGVTPEHVVEIEALISEKTINDKIARQVIGHVADGEGSPGEIIEARSLAVVSDEGALNDAVAQAIADNPDVVEKIKGGKKKAIGALMGPVMKATRGQADAARVQELINEQLGL
ncbi:MULTISPECIES: Asp-tRNA(Asn)/Glu-tRNA(Gln) amidotransferase subunit GatB [Auritidibacter]|uniref:Asp-tRNA(Asn)/Glu-tRNA(Gln) amidotransferase subunit GatB n=1 Tax=Auritidibacter TaxID=1160973 RepID=UPI000D7305C0|nr:MULTISPECIES: Asp-tRNA(Asn)/Glu-tRNA(Gln) amidotransferase subunit GatB [Auritidibacter]PXA77103.1 Asp-tRNA(Asn)/Glu-tRNA(Gln) amidotransferase GatCAB subunit B [Auritidibacter sp. NML120779]AXR73898.1 Asp-tRNA(Asn)/Glu-tRNA(Gln) amidotransferase subunit GatB [Auritidibacter sp. NML130574]NIH72763.1 aspartyl-tRNA(Asn)/glutamyl-tRNA(Gln) amidotransferase subunit B [Auritidibacter ignavus]RMX23833.1 Asp-tRNA(Asn)/Glu-tRNA(Gln) amidotransferase subunit GatB [Auritidibacter ignavus]WGH82602.1 A